MGMGDDEIQRLCDLMQLDLDAVFAYQQTIEIIGERNLQEKFTLGMEDHQRHVLDLENAILGFGGEPPYTPATFKGFKTQGMAPIPKSGSLGEILNAMEVNEELTNTIYEDATSWNLPAELTDLIKKIGRMKKGTCKPSKKRSQTSRKANRISGQILMRFKSRS